MSTPLAETIIERVATNKRRARRVSVADGIFHAVMVGVGESYLGALAVELGYDNTSLALLATIPLLSGAVSQFATAPLTRWLGARKRLVVIGAATQSAVHAGLIWVACSRDVGLVSFLTLKCIYWVSAMVIAPAWGAWMADITDDTDRARYFAWRSAGLQAVLVSAFLASGFWLHAARSVGEVSKAFAAVLSIALVARAGSALLLAAQDDVPAQTRRGERPAPILQVLRDSQWRVALYSAVLMFAAHVSVPFFTPFMLRSLSLDYETFTLLSAASLVTKAILFPAWHRLATRLGFRAVLVGGGALVASVPFFWAAARDMSGLLLAEVMSGIAWAAWEYASFQLLLASAASSHRLEFLSMANSMTGLCQVCGSLCGSQLLERLELSYTQVFIVSGVGRAASIVLLLVAVPPWLSRIRLPRLIMRIVSVRPAGGVMRRPIADALDDVRSDSPP